MFLNTLISSLHRSIYRYPEVIKYLYSRKITEENIEKFNLGYSRVINFINDKSLDAKRFEEECKKGRKLENKIIFPLTGQSGNFVGLSGRGIDSKEFKNFVTNEAKYTGFFFGLYQALPYIYKSNLVFIVEGCIDSIALSNVFPNTVATMTAFLNDDQYKLLRLYCDYIIVIFDSDKKGKFGEEKALNRENVFSINLGYKDPARCLEYLGLNKFKEFMKKKLTDLPGGVLWKAG